MSNQERSANIVQIVNQVESQFNALAKIHNAVNWVRESSFAMQILEDNTYTKSIAMGAPDSLKRAIINVASIGLSLSPIHKLAYLVPRDKKICLDISYRGFIQLAAEEGAIKWALAEIVRKKDKFEYRGLGHEPIHTFEPFADRGEIVGAYVVAKTHHGEFITTIMPINEIYDIRNRSQSWKSFEKDGKKSPWSTDEGEMIKKTVIRRAYKSWPMTNTRERLDSAINISNEADPIDVVAIAPPVEIGNTRSDQLNTIREMIGSLGRTEERYLSYLVRTHSREIKSLEDLTDIEINQSLIYLKQLSDEQKAKEPANEIA